MPVYDYACAACGPFDALRRYDDRDTPASCPECGEASPRSFGHAPRLALLDAATRDAHATNERARNAPISSRDGYARLRHPAGCGCCAPGARKTKTTVLPNGAKTFASKRPWMISH